MIQYLLTAIIDAVVAGIALSKRRDGAAISLALLAISAGFWSIELYLLTIIADPQVLAPWFTFFRTGMFFIPSTMALFVWFLVGKRSRVFFRAVVLPGLLISAALALLNNTLFPSALKPAENGYTAQLDLIYYCFVGVFAWCIIGAIIFCISQYKTAIVREQQRIKWLAITLAIAFLFGMASLYLFSFSFYLSKLSGPLTNVVFLSSLLYATIRHDLMDIRLALGVGLSRILLLTVFCWTYFSLSSASVFTADSVGGTITLLLFFAIVLEAYPKILNWLTPNTKRIFRATRYELDKLTLRAKIDLDKCISIENVTKVLDEIFLERACLSGYSLLLKKATNPDSEEIELKATADDLCLKVDRNYFNSVTQSKINKVQLIDELPGDLRQQIASRADSVISLRIDSELFGVLLVSHPKREKHFGFEDIQLIEWLAKELSQTLWRIKNIEEFEKELNEAKKQLSLINIMNHYHHDIKAPLSVIDGVVTHELYDKDKQRQIILEQVALGSRLITTMANLLKGQRQRQVGPVSINSVIQDCVLIFNHAMANSIIDVSDDAVVMGDADDLKILFINIIKNACEAADAQRKVSIRVRAWREASSLRVSITDDGVGIDNEQLQNIWSSGQSTKEGGSGVGLQAIKRIAEEHNATIDVDSRPGEGTDFTLTFPLSA